MSLTVTEPSSRSEWPPTYLVSASQAKSAPWSSGLKISGVAQVLSQPTSAPLALAACDDGRNILHLHRAGAGQLDPDQLDGLVDQIGDAGADQRIVDAIVDAARLQVFGAEAAHRRVDMVGDQHLVARHQHREHDDGDGSLARGHEHGAHAAMERGELRLQRAGRRRAVQPVGIAVEAAIFARGEGRGVRDRRWSRRGASARRGWRSRPR